jgi:hypothetical protein
MLHTKSVLEAATGASLGKSMALSVVGGCDTGRPPHQLHRAYDFAPWLRLICRQHT